MMHATPTQINLPLSVSTFLVLNKIRNIREVELSINSRVKIMFLKFYTPKISKY